MRKSYLSNVTFKILLPVALFFFSVSNLKAQTDISIGTGTTSNDGTGYPAPLQDYYEGSRMQFLYRASELTAAGMQAGNINSVKYNVTNLNGFSGTIEQMSVKIGTTTTTSLSQTAWESITNVVVAPVDYVPFIGVNELVFSSPFFLEWY